MVLVDNNLWLALLLDKHAHHPLVTTWFDAQPLDGSICFCRATQVSLVRLLTTSAVLLPYGTPPLTNHAAWSAYIALRRDERIGWMEEPAKLEETWSKLGAIKSASPKLWMDAYLAAFAIAGGFQLVTLDKAFKQFKGLNATVIPSSRKP